MNNIKVSDHRVSPEASGLRVLQVAASGTATRTSVREPTRSPQDAAPCDRLHIKGLVDSTLREGSQTVGLAFSLDQKVAIAEYLTQIGIEEVEVGVASPLNKELPALVHRCRTEAGLRRLGLWCRCQEKDLSFAHLLAPDVLSLSIPVSDRHMAVKLGIDRVAVTKMVARNIARARIAAPYVSLGLEDATRADPVFLREIASSAESVGRWR